LDRPTALKEIEMLPPLFTRLCSDEFIFSIGFLHTPSSVRKRLLESPTVRELSSVLRFGGITEELIRSFVSFATNGLVVGRRLPSDLALAAIAVALELRPTEFAEEYLHDLARIRLPFPEMGVSIRVARECLKLRCEVPKHQRKSFRFPGKERAGGESFVVENRRFQAVFLRPRVSAYPTCVDTI
jgi:hypothetical protein